MFIPTLANLIRDAQAIGSAASASVGYASQRFAEHMAGSVVQSLEIPGVRDLSYRANQITPSVIPDPDALFRLYYSGLITKGELQGWIAYHGVSLTDEPDESTALMRHRSRLWNKALNLQRPTFDLTLWRKWRRQNRINDAQYFDALARHGFPAGFLQTTWLGDYENLTIGTIVDMYRYGRITRVQALALVQQLGFRPADADHIIATSTVALGVPEIIRLAQTGVIAGQDIDKALSAAGITSVIDQFRALTMLNTMPSMSDIVATAGRQSWDNGISGRWGLDFERPPEFDVWAARTGLNYSAGVGDFGAPDANAPKWSDLAWRDHWKLLDIRSLAIAIHRVRGNPVDPNTWSIPGVMPLTPQDIDDVLKAGGIAPQARPLIMGTIYNPISVRHLRLIQTHRPQPRAWVVGKYQDMGYSPDDAALTADALLDDVRIQSEKPLAQAIKKANDQFVTEVLTAYRDGAVDYAGASTAMENLGMDGYVITVKLTTEDMRVNVATIQAVAKRARSDWFAGRTNLAGAQQRLHASGMAPVRVQQMLTRWQAERGEGRVVLSTGKTLQLLRQGFISAADALTRLDNLGWNRPDEILLLAQVQAEINADAIKAAHAADLATKKANAEMERLLEKNTRMQDKILAHMAKQTPVRSIMKWVRDGIWTAKQAAIRLDKMGYEPEAIQAMLQEDAVEQKGGPRTADAQAQRILENLRRETPPSAILKWLKDGEWTRAQAESRLSLLGYPSDVIRTMIDDELRK